MPTDSPPANLHHSYSWWGKGKEREWSGGREQIHETKGDKPLMTAAQHKASLPTDAHALTHARTHSQRAIAAACTARTNKDVLRQRMSRAHYKAMPAPSSTPEMHLPLLSHSRLSNTWAGMQFAAREIINLISPKRNHQLCSFFSRIFLKVPSAEKEGIVPLGGRGRRG